jgi:DNA-binding transcriptional ArsR family regulator
VGRIPQNGDEQLRSPRVQTFGAEEMAGTKASLRTSRGVTGSERRLTAGGDITAVSLLLKNASDPARLMILLALADGERDTIDLAASLEAGIPRLMANLALLTVADLVARHRHGNRQVYSLTARGRGITALVETLLREEQARTSQPIPIDPKLLDDVRGFVDDPDEWFRTPNVAFEGRQLIELLGTADESRLRNRIEAAKHGMFS